MTIEYDPDRLVEFDERDVEYRCVGGEPLLARVYQPRGTGPFPIMLHVHGGQWTNSNNRAGEPAPAKSLAASGVVVAAIDLRTTPKYHYPDAPQDVNYAVRWLKAHAADFNADAATLGAFGGSSGGHLVELTAMRPRDSRYTEPVPGLGDDASLVYLFTRAPISDPFARFEWAVERGRHDIDEHTHAFFQPWEEIFDANPQRILERGEAAPLPPLLIVQGSEDDNIPPSIQTHFAETYRAAGGYVEYEEFPGAPHQFLNQPGADSEHALRLAREFIARQLKTLQPVGG